jgi:hypothetical protein
VLLLAVMVLLAVVVLLAVLLLLVLVLLLLVLLLLLLLVLVERPTAGSAMSSRLSCCSNERTNSGGTNK